MSSNHKHLEGVHLLRYWGGIDPGFEHPSTWATSTGIGKPVEGAPPATGPALLQTQRWRVVHETNGTFNITQETLTKEARHGFTLKDKQAKEGTEIVNDLSSGEWKLENVREFGDAGEFTAVIVPAGHERYAIGRRQRNTSSEHFLLELQLKDGPEKPLLWRFLPVVKP